jgi:hypothetical protein
VEYGKRERRNIKGPKMENKKKPQRKDETMEQPTF